MTRPSSSGSAIGTTPDPIAERLRERRRALGLSLRSLAERIGVAAPSHVLGIENGTKIPSERVAERLAEALGEDPDAVRAWVRLRRRGPLGSALDAAAALARAGLGPAPATVASVPLIAEGADPGDAAAPGCPVLDEVRVDARLLGGALAGAFAVRVSAASALRARGALRAGEVAVVTRPAGRELFPHRVYAVRHRGGIALGHASIVADTVVVAGRAGEAPELHVGFDPRRRDPVLVGRVALTLRPWL